MAFPSDKPVFVRGRVGVGNTTGTLRIGAKTLPCSFQALDGGINNIRSISQRVLAIHWTRIASGNQIPRFDQFDFDSRIHDPKQLAVWDVEQRNGPIVLRALYSGCLLNEPFNAGWAGRTLEELTPPSLRSAIVSGSHECVRTGCAIYMILRTCDSMGYPVDLERLLLPYGRNGQVEQIVASLQLISLEGMADRKKIIHDFEKQSDCILSVRIPCVRANTTSTGKISDLA
jgi:hypothetical protein